MDYRERRKAQARQTEQAILQAAMELSHEDSFDHVSIRDICKEAGVTLTPAGAAFPYGIDPRDTNIRLAPSYPELGELEQAARLFCLAVKMASVEYLLTTSV